LYVRFEQPGLFGRTVVAAVKDGSFDTQLPLGTYELSVDGCKMPLHWMIDPEGVCVLGPEAPAGIYGGQ
jgi:hypothetical protein